MKKLISLALILTVAICLAAGHKTKKPGEKNSMKSVVDSLGAEITVTSKIKSLDDLRVILTLTNESQTPIRLNAMDLDAPSLILKFARSNGTPLPTGPPPVPSVNDGETGRVMLVAGTPFVHTFQGPAILATALSPGHYTVAFTYSNAPGFAGEWVGSIETKPVSFEVITPALHVLP